MLFPQFHIYNKTYSTYANSIMFSDIILGFIALSVFCTYLVGLFNREFYMFSPSYIFCIGYGFKMTWVHTGRITAQMVNYISFWDCALILFIVISMRRVWKTIFYAHSAISIFVFASLPIPTICFCINDIFNRTKPRVMPLDKSLRHSFYSSSSGIGFFSNWGGVSTPAFTSFHAATIS